ncbi:tetratricopeptide repeat protein [candidate division KSB1 bacterium]|nr:tetratricopeptide repeat protein [candidate division KSB1 bacterium]
MKKAPSGTAPICAFSTTRERITRLILLMPTLTLLVFDDAVAQASRAVSAKSYVERGNSWLEKGEIERAIADYDLALAFDSRAAARWGDVEA